MKKFILFLMFLPLAFLAKGQHWSDWERIHPILHKDVHIRIRCSVSGEEVKKAYYEVEFRNGYIQDMQLQLVFSLCEDCEETDLFTLFVEKGTVHRIFLNFEDTECRDLIWNLKEFRFLRPD